MLQILCKTCLTAVTVPAGTDTDVHDAIECGCCPEDHHHGRAAAECPEAHEEPCWSGPQSGPRPDGCTVCRPLLIMPMAGVRLASAPQEG